MKTKLFIPEKIKVGYQKREGTYTKKLAYVIYYDSKGKLRKETSWESWRDKKIPADEFENKSTEGFVLNKGVGGTRESYGWNARNEYIRVYDPRGFEFEISVANLLFILQEATSTKGKGLEGEFVYSWDMKELVLLPIDSNDYKECYNFTGLQSKKIDAKEMVPGCIYKFKNTETAIYLGRFPFRSEIFENEFKKCHIFYSDTAFENAKWNFPKNYKVEDGFTKIAERVTTAPVDNYAELLEKYLNSIYSQKCIGLLPVEKELKTINDRYNDDEKNIYINQNGNFYKIYFDKSYRWDGIAEKKYYMGISHMIKFDTDKLIRVYDQKPYVMNRAEYTLEELQQKYKFYNLYALLENKPHKFKL